LSILLLARVPASLAQPLPKPTHAVPLAPLVATSEGTPEGESNTHSGATGHEAKTKPSAERGAATKRVFQPLAAALRPH